MYQRPYTKEEIIKNYPEKVSGKLLKDKIHIWRAETGIELIHKEPTKIELERIWKNWQEMTEKEKRISDEKSIDFFDITNKENYIKILKEYENN